MIKNKYPSWFVALICALGQLITTESGITKPDSLKSIKKIEKIESKQLSKGTTHSVPDGGTTIALLALGVAGCGAALRFLKKR